jgi:hypothetical protein
MDWINLTKDMVITVMNLGVSDDLGIDHGL